MLGKRGQARIAASLEAKQIGETYRVIDPARIPERPEGPDRLSIGLFGSAVGFVAGLLLLLVASMRPPTLPPMTSIAGRPGFSVSAM